MYKLFLGVIIVCVLIANVYAQSITVEKPITCGATKSVIESLTGKEYDEQLFWVGTDEDSRYAVLRNEKSGAWTIIQFNEKLACVLGAGDSSRQVFSKPAV